jgi:N-acetylmuramoyl-L-alanine amidase
VDGVTSVQVNVRAQPSTGSTVLGIIPAETRVEITGKNPGEGWWQINYPHPEALDGKGWVTAQYVVTANKDQVPVIGGEETATAGGNAAIIQQQLNVRSGPGTGFNSLGTLNPQDVVQLTGKDPNGAWLQIEYATGPDGRGWVNAAFVRAQGVGNLPIIAESGQIVGTGTPTEVPPTPTLTVVPAWEDNDSAASPIVRVTFDPTGTQTLIYNGDVSAPNGDIQDWIEFIPFGRRVRVEVACQGDVQMELRQDGKLTSEQPQCAVAQVVSVEPDHPVQIHVRALLAGSLRYSSYTVKVTAIP